MSIRAKYSALLILVMCAMMAASNIFFYQYIRSLLERRIVEEQSVAASSNQMGIEYFFQSIDQSFQFLIADKLVGDTLSRAYDDPDKVLERLAARRDVTDQFFHCTTALTGIDGYSYRSILFLSDRIPLAASFEVATMDSNRDLLSSVYSNTAVKNEPWYVNTMERGSPLSIFIDEENDLLCLARKVQNVYYVGPQPSQGIGVMVTQVSRRRLESFFQFSQITPQTQVMLLNSLQSVLYQTNRSPGEPLPDFLSSQDSVRDIDGQRVCCGGEDYIANVRRLAWGMTLAFLTPYADVTEQLSGFQRLYFVGSLITLAAVTAVMRLLAGRISRPIIALADTMKNIQDTRLIRPEDFAPATRDEIGALYRSFGGMVAQVNALIEEVAQQTARQKSAELKALQAQMNPHFIYNAMDSVSWLALTNGQDEIADIVSRIAAIMRYAISRPDEIVALGRELENIQDYVALQNMRYGGRIHFSVEIAADCADIAVPKLTLQPLVENSILHGFADSQEELSIRVCARREGESVVLTESDSGRGADGETVNAYLSGQDGVLKVRGGYGIRNVNGRLKLKFGDGGGLLYRNLPDGSLQAVIRVPFTKVKSPHNPTKIPLSTNTDRA